MRRRLKSPALRLLTQQSIRAQIKARKHQSSASLAFVRGIHRGPVNSPHKWPVTQKMFPFDDVIMGVPTHSLQGIDCDPVSRSRWHLGHRAHWWNSGCRSLWVDDNAYYPLNDTILWILDKDKRLSAEQQILIEALLSLNKHGSDCLGMGRVTKLRLSCYLVLLSIDSKTR